MKHEAASEFSSTFAPQTTSSLLVLRQGEESPDSTEQRTS